MALEVNRVYLASVAFVCTLAALSVAWLLTRYTYGAWTQGVPLQNGWHWWSVVGTGALFIACGAAVYRKIYADFRTTLNAHGIARPRLIGAIRIPWSEVTGVGFDGGAHIRIIAEKGEVTLSRYAFRDPERIVEYIHSQIEGRKLTGAP
jgi:hypothetical protein